MLHPVSFSIAMALTSLCDAVATSPAAGASTVELMIDASQTAGEIDLRRYALGQGGLSDQPMFDAHVAPIEQLHPETIRLFVQE